MPPAPLIRTARLVLRELDDGDAGFVLELLNQPDFLRYIGDRGVRDLEQARAYLRNGPIDSYARHGHGLYAVETHDGGPIGLCGLLQRTELPAPDLGIAFLPACYGKGYAAEAASAVLRHAREAQGIGRVLAIVAPDNARCIALLRRLGMREAGTVRIGNEGIDLLLFEAGES